jgi:hypothetical protein
VSHSLLSLISVNLIRFFWGDREGESSYFDPHLLRLSGAMTAQSFVKHLLTEGDKMIISQVSPLKDQGGYAVASNYGTFILSTALKAFLMQ